MFTYLIDQFDLTTLMEKNRCILIKISKYTIE